MKAEAIISDFSPFAFYIMNLNAIRTNHILIVPFLRGNWQLGGALVCVLKSVKSPPPQHGLKINMEPHYHTRLADIVVLWKWNVQLLWQIFKKLKKITHIQVCVNACFKRQWNKNRRVCVNPQSPLVSEWFSSFLLHFQPWEGPLRKEKAFISVQNGYTRRLGEKSVIIESDRRVI